MVRESKGPDKLSPEEEAERRVDEHHTREERRLNREQLERQKSPGQKSVEATIRRNVELAREELKKIYKIEKVTHIAQKQIDEIINSFENIAKYNYYE